jgi:general secretion pathway protein G
LLELVIVVVLIGGLTTLAAKRLLVLRTEAERAALIQVLGGLRAAVSLEMLTRISGGRDAELGELVGSNPMEMLVEPPRSYVGAFDAPDPSTMPPGRWYFDRSEKVLVYRVRYAERFESELTAPPRVAFRVEVVFDDRNGDGSYQPGVDGTSGTRISAVAPYGWRS